MPYISGQPYTDFHQTNLDWMVKELIRLKQLVEGDIREEIEKVLAEAFVDITYNSTDKSISFFLTLGD